MRREDDAPEGRLAARSRARALLFLAIAVVAGGTAVMLVRRYTDEMATAFSEAAPKTTPVVVAALDLPIAVRLEGQHLKVVQWPANHVPEGAFASVKEVLEKTLRQDLVKGEPVLKERLADEAQGQGLAALLADGMRAMAVEVNAAVGVAGFVQPGDFVDVITTMRPDEETKKQRNEDSANVSKLILQSVHVLAVGEHLTTEPGGKPVNVKVVTLGVTPAESEKLALASQYGQLQLALRSRVDRETRDTTGVSPAQLLASDIPAAAPMPVPEPEKPRRAYREHHSAPPPPPVESPAAVAAPVVEILRGGQIESRTLRTQGMQ
ncbi:MAG: Flp pilus assembly protein CpaB [Myxococcales bacterium]